MPNSSSSLLQYSYVALHGESGVDAHTSNSTAALAQHLLNRDVFQYDFSKEKAIVEGGRGRRMPHDTQNDEELAKAGMAILNMAENGEAKPHRLGRRNSADDVAAAIAASLKEY